MSEMPGIGVPAATPARPSEQLRYPAVHDMPPQRTNALLTAAEQKNLEDELTEVRDRQLASAGMQVPAPKKASESEKKKTGRSGAADRLDQTQQNRPARMGTIY